MSDDPITRFHELLAEAARAEAGDPTAMALATADEHGRPSVRMVLLKEADARGFAFYTNLGSRKAGELRANPWAALCFHWPAIAYQVRVEGPVEPVSDAEADAYFASRPRGSQIGAWASRQSAPIGSRDELLAAYAAHERRFDGAGVPRPPFWSGWRVVPQDVEIWKSEPSRLHRRVRYSRTAVGWTVTLLQP